MHLEELRRRLRAWTAFVQEGLAARRTAEEMGAELQARDAADPTTSPAGVRQLDLAAGYAMSVAGIARYLTKLSAAGGQPLASD